MGGGREKNKTVKVCKVIEFYKGRVEYWKKLNKQIINYVIYF